MPGLAVLIGGMWVANLYYWGFNQYIIQRTLAAKSLEEGQKGIAFAAFLKLLIPIFVVLPGIIVYVMNLDASGSLAVESLDQGFIGANGSIVNDNAAPWLIKEVIPVGLKGLILAALAAAIVSSLASMLNSTGTIFTMDIYRQTFNKNATEKQMVTTGRISAAIALIIAVIMAPLLGDIPQAFQYIQEYTGIVSPGILAIFLLGLFWRKTTNRGAIWGALSSIPIALYLKVGSKGWFKDTSLESFFPEMPFLDQMLYTSLLTMLIIAIVSRVQNKGSDDLKGIKLKDGVFSTSKTFNIGSFAVMILLTAIYSFFW